jgi:hypothetical protein
VRFPALAGAALLPTLLLTPCLAQQLNETPLHELLVRLQANLSAYLSTVPSFFCDEHVESATQEAGYDGKITTNTDSVFRLKRVGEGDATQLLESREIKAVNKKSAEGQNITGPAIFRGAFRNGISMVSLEVALCFDYQRMPDEKINGVKAIVISYAALPDAAGDRNCPNVQSGRAYFDPRDLHPLRVEARVPNYVIIGNVIGLWTWSVDYASVILEGKTFWMPKTIESRAVSNDNRAEWSFVAKYRNYHKLEVTSHIITDVGGNPPPP